MNNYTSILICEHPEQGITNIYLNGLSIGTIQGGEFIPDKLIEVRIKPYTLIEIKDKVDMIFKIILKKPVDSTAK